VESGVEGSLNDDVERALGGEQDARLDEEAEAPLVL